MRYGTLPKRHPPGTEWRTLVYADGFNERIEQDSDDFADSVFDELVIDGWFHLEQMTDRKWWMAVYREDGTRVCINVHVGERGLARHVLIEEDG